MEIIITKNNVYQYAMALTARAATATTDYAQAAISEDNFPMLDVYMSESVSYAEGLIRRKLSKSSNINMKLDEQTIKIFIKDEDVPEKPVHNLIESSVRLFLAYNIACRWLQCSPASNISEVYGNIAISHLNTAVDSFNQKEYEYVSEEEYTQRKNDNLLARDGMRILQGEIITVRDKDGGSSYPAETCYSECLISKKQ